ncbi:MAG: DUF3102 domain-containing protein [Iphinoe sp. HA4291-MV1]|jgi:hypothetical protein|nr:DUF3102 domain-containing protein [Iphinoe sp. HA4291-MV1]
MNQGVAQAESLSQLSTQDALDFDYDAFNTETRSLIQQRTSEIKALMRRNAQDIINIGQKLIEVKQHLGHGKFTIWLKSEFNWSVSAANKFMQVGQQFKFVKFTNLNIAASALYLIAAPSIPQAARAEVIERMSLSENITYTKAKEIVLRHKKTPNPNCDKSVTVVSALTAECENTPFPPKDDSLCQHEKQGEQEKLLKQEERKEEEILHWEENSKSVAPVQHKGSAASLAPAVLTKKEVQTQTHSQLFPGLKPSSDLRNQHLATVTKKNRDTLDDTTQTVDTTLNQGVISHSTSDTVTTEMAMSIKNLTPEQLASVIRKSVNNGLSDHHLQVIITEAEQALKKQ